MTDTPTPAVVAQVRRRYLAHEPVKAIAAEAAMSAGTLYRCLAGDFADGSGTAPAPIAKRRAGIRGRARLGSRGALVARMWRTAELQVEEIEERLKAAGLELAERESNARTLAIVAKTLRELAVFDEDKKARGKHAARSDDDDPMPRDLDEFRRDLARRINALVDSRTGAGLPDAGGE